MQRESLVISTTIKQTNKQKTKNKKIKQKHQQKPQNKQQPKTQNHTQIEQPTTIPCILNIPRAKRKHKAIWLFTFDHKHTIAQLSH